MLIAIDTSTRYAGIALWDAEGLIGETNWLAGREQTAQLLPEIEHLLKRAGATPAGLTAIGVALGPGSFNGLRVGLSSAKALAQSLNLPLIGIPTLDATAAAVHPSGNLTLWAVLEAGRGRFGVGHYRARNTQWQRQGDFMNLSSEEFSAQVTAPAIITGEISQSDRAYLSSTLAKQVTLTGPGQYARRAAFLAEIAWGRHQAGEHDDIVSLEPLYLRQPVIGKPRPGLIASAQE